MQGLGRRLGAGGLAIFSALSLAAVGASVASASDRVNGYSAQIGTMRVNVYSQMCDGGGPNLHTRLVVKNVGSTAKQVFVHDAFARTVYDPPGPVQPGKGTLVHLTSSRSAPAHNLTLSVDGHTETMPVPESPCTSTTTSSSTTTSTTKPHGSSTTTSSTTKPSNTSTTVVTVGPGGGPGDPGATVVTQPGVVVAGTSTGNGPGTAVKPAAAAATLPFTGSDIRLFAVLGNLLVLVGFALLFLAHRSPRASALLKRLRPGTSA
jgi:hypothetical protein